MDKERKVYMDGGEHFVYVEKPIVKLGVRCKQILRSTFPSDISTDTKPMRPMHKNMRMAHEILPMLKRKEKVAFAGNDYAFKNMKALLICIGANYDDLEYFSLVEAGKQDGLDVKISNIYMTQDEIKTYKEADR